MVACGLPHYGRGDLALARHEIAAAQQNFAGLRRYGAATLDLAWVACGRLDAYWERDLSPWDLAAGSLLVREAGGFVSDCDGKGDIFTARPSRRRQRHHAPRTAAAPAKKPPRSRQGRHQGSCGAVSVEFFAAAYQPPTTKMPPIALWLKTWQATYPELDFAERLSWWRERWRNELLPAAQDRDRRKPKPTG